MAKVTFDTILALRNTAQRLEMSKDYQWGHMGSCNCGFLAQEITKLNKTQIHSRAMQRSGDWSEQLNDYCPSTGILMDELITVMIDFGFEIDELKHLERLTDPGVLKTLSPDKRVLIHNSKDDVVLYLRAWSDILEKEWLATLYIIERSTHTFGKVNAHSKLEVV
jgi:hypothetical protein